MRMLRSYLLVPVADSLKVHICLLYVMMLMKEPSFLNTIRDPYAYTKRLYYATWGP